MKVPALVLLLISLPCALFSQDTVIKPPEECIGCSKIVIHGKLAQILKISSCEGISGMTCRIQFAQRSVELPSRIVVRQLDTHGHVLGSKFLPYPNLKPGETGRASFLVGTADTLVLVGEFGGPWKSAY